MLRRGFLKAILIAGTTPAIVRAQSLMHVKGFVIPEAAIILPERGIIAPSLVTGERLFTALIGSGAAIEAELKGLVEFRRSHSEIQFILPRPDTSRYTEYYDRLHAGLIH